MCRRTRRSLIVLIVAPRADLHGRVVAKHLLDLGTPVRFLDVSQLGNGSGASVSIGRTGATIFEDEDGALDLAQVDCVWWRRPYQPTPTFARPNDVTFARAEWMSLVHGAFASSAARFVSPPAAQRDATKPLQLALARELGLATPETLITNSLDRTRAFLAANRGAVIHKPLTPPEHSFPDARLWDADAEAAIEGLHRTPVILQECIQGPGDLRVTAFGEEAFAAFIETSAARVPTLDSRVDIAVPTTPYDLPSGVVEQLRSLMWRLGLSYGAIDLKVRDDGSLVFLEINPQGQFLYIEILTGQPISQSFAGFLSRLVRSQFDAGRTSPALPCQAANQAKAG